MRQVLAKTSPKDQGFLRLLRTLTQRSQPKIETQADQPHRLSSRRHFPL